MEDLSELIDSDESVKLQNLQNRYNRDEIYTYASKILIAINPLRSIPCLYGPTEMHRYQERNRNTNPPHIYAVANEAFTNISNDSQSIIISGISGSGKTESSKHIVEYLCNLYHGNFEKDILINTNLILEAFGNAQTTENKNSSRFCKFLELHYDRQPELIGARIRHHLLEVTRVCSRNTEESNFNVFYSMLYGAPNELKEQLRLHNECFRFLPNACKHSEIRLVDFDKIDASLTSVGFNECVKTRIYKILAAILHLGNIEFDNADDDSCQISTESLTVCHHAANLLSIDPSILQANLLTRSIVIRESNISVSLNKNFAKKSRDNFVKRLYSYLFEEVVCQINSSTEFGNSNAYIGILDIAGFECLRINAFEQFCINYINERMQNYFIRTAILDEKQWYEKEGIDVPSIPFFDNTNLVEMFDNTTNGVFSLLDDECILSKTTAEKFTNNVYSTWNGHEALFQSNRDAPSRLQSPTHSFTIRHFSGDVTYSTVDFIEKNHSTIPEILQKLAYFAVRGHSETNCWSELKLKRTKSIGQSIKSGSSALIEKLKNTNSQFIHCIKPNLDMVVQKFDECMVLRQLRSSSTLAYADFVCFGFPLRISVAKIQSLYAHHYHICASPRKFHMKLLLAIGLRIGQFKLGQNFIFFRSDQHEKMQQLLSVISCVHALKRYKARTRWLIVIMLLVKFKRKVKKPEVENKILMNLQEREPAEFSVKIDERTLNEDKDGEKKIDSSNLMASQAELERKKATKKNNDGNENLTTTRKNTKKPFEGVQYDGFSHWPEIDSKKNASRCKNKNCTFKTHFYCSKCETHLCIRPNRNCFKQFHIFVDELID